MTTIGATGAQDAPAPADTPRVVVAMLTCRRVDDLRVGIPLVLAQLGDAPGPTAMLVVDNDPDGSAMGITDDIVDDRLRVVHEAERGIAAARNRALDEAGDADLLVFIDDDERPGPSWLRSLVDEWLRTRPAAVAGRVVSEYEVEPEPWIQAGGFFERRRLPTGTEITVAATNNLLLDLHQVRSAGVRFDDRFGASGGEDTLFTRTIRQRGGRMVWCNEAFVVDVVPAARVSRRFVLRRAFSYGNTYSRVSIVLATGAIERMRSRLVLTAKGLARVVAGGLRYIAGAVFLSMRWRARGARRLMRGLGTVSGAWGHTHIAYGHATTADGSRGKSGKAAA